MKAILWLVQMIGAALSVIGIILGALPALLVQWGDALSQWAREEAEDL